MEYYAQDPCKEFIPHTEKPFDEKNTRLIAQMHKAISIIQFKLEAQMRLQHPEWEMNSQGTLENIDYQKGVYILDGKEYELKDTLFPTVDPKNPYKLTSEEESLVNKLHHSFRISEKLQKHIRCLLSHGCMYGVFNGNLLFHASIPLNEDGSLKEVALNGKKYKGKELLHNIGMYIRTAFQNDASKTERQKARDYFWYLWCGPDSPLFDKNKMTTFERYFLTDSSLYHEEKGNYYKLREKPEICDIILDAFEVKGSNRHIINGHVPVHASQGENPIKADGRLMVIDGGFAKAYHKTTGIAGYTLVYHSRGFLLIQHEPFTSTREAIMNETDIKSSTQIEVMTGKRVRVRDTDKGIILQRQVKELRELLYAYQHGIIKEK
jgi:fructose-1,6-bisphosphatase-3